MPSTDIIDFLRDRDSEFVWNLSFRKALLLLTIKECILEISEIDKKLNEKAGGS